MTDPLPPSIIKHFLIPRADQRKAAKNSTSFDRETGVGFVDQERLADILRGRFPDEKRALDLWNSVTKAELWEHALRLIGRDIEFSPNDRAMINTTITILDIEIGELRGETDSPPDV